MSSWLESQEKWSLPSGGVHAERQGGIRRQGLQQGWVAHEKSCEEVVGWWWTRVCVSSRRNNISEGQEVWKAQNVLQAQSTVQTDRS